MASTAVWVSLLLTSHHPGFFWPSLQGVWGVFSPGRMEQGYPEGTGLYLVRLYPSPASFPLPSGWR